MPTTFTAEIDYAGNRVTVETDSFEEMHQALAGLAELNRDADYMRSQGIEDIVPVFRQDDQENKYYGFQDAHSRRNITFGTKRAGGTIPFFPKGAEGYYEPSGGKQNGRAGYRPKDRLQEQEPSMGAPADDTRLKVKKKLARIAKEADFDLQAELPRVIREQTGAPAPKADAKSLRWITEKIESGELQSAAQKQAAYADDDDNGLPF